MFRTVTYLAAAALLTTGAVAAMAAQPDNRDVEVTINKTGEYCVRTPAATGSYLDRTECHSASDWQKQGVTISRR
jgi:hypothetical protein